MDFAAYMDAIIASDEGEWLCVARPVFLQDCQEMSGPSGHWVEVAGHHSLYTLRTNLSIAIAVGLPHRDDFADAWVKGFPDTKARSHFIDLLWCGRPIHRLIGVAVDGGRATLPLPIGDTLEVPKRAATFFKLLDGISGGDVFADYFKMAGFSPVDVAWPV